jgi:hypothetical protein
MVVNSAEPGRDRQIIPQVSKARLTAGRAALVELMQDINFGRIEGLVVSAREPVFDPAPRIVREIKFGGENGARPEAGAKDFALKSQVVELLAYFDGLENTTIEVLVVKHGLPFSMSVEAAA